MNTAQHLTAGHIILILVCLIAIFLCYMGIYIYLTKKYCNTESDDDNDEVNVWPHI